MNRLLFLLKQDHCGLLQRKTEFHKFFRLHSRVTQFEIDSSAWQTISDKIFCYK